MREIGRVMMALALMFVTASCAYFSISVREAPPEAWWAYWFLYATVGLLAMFGAAYLLRPRQPHM